MRVNTSKSAVILPTGLVSEYSITVDSPLLVRARITQGIIVAHDITFMRWHSEGLTRGLMLLEHIIAHARTENVIPIQAEGEAADRGRRLLGDI